MKRFFRLSVVLSGMLLLSACNNAPANPEGDKNTTNPNDNNDGIESVTIILPKKTGQTKSYDEEGGEVTDGSIKDDGFYQKGVTPSYTRNNDKEIVIDNVTKLQWQDNDSAGNNVKNWGNAKVYCSELALGGYTDWRLPTRAELVNLSEYGYVGTGGTSMSHEFINVDPDPYWSSTSYAGDEDSAWVVNFFDGGQLHLGMNHSFLVRCVRIGQQQ